MASQAIPFRLTADDLPDLDKKTREGLEPLLDALNTTINSLVNGASGAVNEELRQVTLSTESTVVASFPLVFSTSISRPRFVAMVCTPKDPNHVLTTPFVMQGFSLTDKNQVSIPAITGVLPQNVYYLTFLIRA